MNVATPHRRVRRRGQAAHHARHLRAVGRLLRRLLREGPAGPDARRRRRSRTPTRGSTSCSGRRRRPPRSRSASTPTTRWRCTCPTSAPSRRTWPATRRSACRSAPTRRPAGRGPGHGPGLGEAMLFAVAGALERAAGGGAVTDSAAGRLGDGDRARGALRARHRDQALLRLPERVRRRAEHQHLPGLPRAARLAAGAQPPGGRARHADRHRAPLRDRRRRSSTGRTTSIPTCRRTTRSASTTSRSTSAAARARRRDSGRHRAGPHRGGHRQDHPRRRRRPDRGRRLLPRRLQPGRRAARGDRERARHPLRRAGPRVRHRAAVDPGRHRRLRRADGGGVDAGRRQRVGPPGGRALRHPLRGQEPELDALARPGHRVRGRAPGRAARGGGAGRPGDPALGRGAGTDPLHALQGGGRRLPLLPRARPGPARPRRRVAGGGGSGTGRAAG